MFVTRKFPPSVGGMETLAAGVWRSMVAVRPDARLIALGRSNRHLVWWLPLALFRVGGSLARGRSFVLTGDALMYAVTRPILVLLRIPHATMVHGLDVTFDNRLYRAVVVRALRRAPRVVANSAATARHAIEVGVPPERVVTVRLGVLDPDTTADDRTRAGRDLRRLTGLRSSDIALLTLGRLVRRKGVGWFVEAVLPQLAAEVHYIVAGDGPERSAISEAARRAGVAGRVHLLGRVDDDTRATFLAGADVFVQPNVPIPGDMEGFGLVTIEAAIRGTPVLAADLEGIKDAVIDGVTGDLVAAGDAAAWTARLATLVADTSASAAVGADRRPVVREMYGEAAMGRALLDVLGVRPDTRPGT